MGRGHVDKTCSVAPIETCKRCGRRVRVFNYKAARQRRKYRCGKFNLDGSWHTCKDKSVHIDLELHKQTSRKGGE